MVSTRPGLYGPKKQFQPVQISNSGYPSATLEVELGFVVVDFFLPEPNVELFLRQTKLSVLSYVCLNEFESSIIFYPSASDGNTYLDLC